MFLAVFITHYLHCYCSIQLIMPDDTNEGCYSSHQSPSINTDDLFQFGVTDVHIRIISISICLRAGSCVLKIETQYRATFVYSGIQTCNHMHRG